jgi:hypothetical protein
VREFANDVIRAALTWFSPRIVGSSRTQVNFLHVFGIDLFGPVIPFTSHSFLGWKSYVQADPSTELEPIESNGISPLHPRVLPSRPAEIQRIYIQIACRSGL